MQYTNDNLRCYTFSDVRRNTSLQICEETQAYKSLNLYYIVLLYVYATMCCKLFLFLRLLVFFQQRVEFVNHCLNDLTAIVL